MRVPLDHINLNSIFLWFSVHIVIYRQINITFRSARRPWLVPRQQRRRNWSGMKFCATETFEFAQWTVTTHKTIARGTKEASKLNKKNEMPPQLQMHSAQMTNTGKNINTIIACVCYLLLLVTWLAIIC